MNWIYTWHNPRRDLAAAELAEQMADTFLYGVLGASGTSGRPRPAPGKRIRQGKGRRFPATDPNQRHLNGTEKEFCDGEH
jgi:hypothetical protein